MSELLGYDGCNATLKPMMSVQATQLARVRLLRPNVLERRGDSKPDDSRLFRGFCRITSAAACDELGNKFQRPRHSVGMWKCATLVKLSLPRRR